METLKEVLIERDNLSDTEADELINEAKHALDCYRIEGNIADAENICEEFFGLEQDFLLDLLL